MNILRILVIAAALGPVSAFACTMEEVNAKATELSTTLQELVAKDQDKAMAVTQRMSDIQMKQANPGSMQEVCKMYDDLIAEMRK